MADLWKEAGDLKTQGEDVANFKEAVTKLPYQLTDEFRKAQDPALDNQINDLQSKTFGAAIKGLDMYQGISNPFDRRNLAEEYQGGIRTQWQNAVDEKTRRTGVYNDYISKWTGLFGAEAAKKQDQFANAQQSWNNEKTLADTEESNRRWNIENARAAGSASNKDYTNQEITATFNQLKNNGADWGTIAKYLGEKGVDVSTGSYADVQLNTAYGTGNYPTKPSAIKDMSPTEQLANMKLESAQKTEAIKQSAKSSSSEAKNGDYYWDGTTLKKKKTGLFGIDWLAGDQTVDLGA